VDHFPSEFPAGYKKKEKPEDFSFQVAPSDIISNLFLEDLERIWELKKWIPDPCNPHLRDLKQDDEEDKQP
jgi:hypothetical protein